MPSFARRQARRMWPARTRPSRARHWALRLAERRGPRMHQQPTAPLANPASRGPKLGGHRSRLREAKRPTRPHCPSVFETSKGRGPGLRTILRHRDEPGDRRRSDMPHAGRAPIARSQQAHERCVVGGADRCGDKSMTRADASNRPGCHGFHDDDLWHGVRLRNAR